MAGCQTLPGNTWIFLNSKLTVLDSLGLTSADTIRVNDPGLTQLPQSHRRLYTVFTVIFMCSGMLLYCNLIIVCTVFLLLLLWYYCNNQIRLTVGLCWSEKFKTSLLCLFESREKNRTSVSEPRLHLIGEGIIVWDVCVGYVTACACVCMCVSGFEVSLAVISKLPEHFPRHQKFKEKPFETSLRKNRSVFRECLWTVRLCSCVCVSEGERGTQRWGNKVKSLPWYQMLLWVP